jgi:signal transduction histidine kinase
MKKQIWIATLLYTLSILSTLGFLYTLINSNIELIVVIISITFLSLGFGYTLSSYILSQKFEIDENLLHLTKEILHEINIPISTIQANSKLLKRTLKNNEKALKRLERIDNSSVRLERLYRELVYSIKKEIHSVEKESFRVDRLIEERVSILKLQQRNYFLLYLDSLTISVDKIGFEKIVDNILTNAMKYSDKQEPITIYLKGNILTIEDRGIGMDETELITIYERYYQSDNSSNGEGIGLALVKAYCDDEKIKILISSQKGEGTKVSLDLLNVTC